MTEKIGSDLEIILSNLVTVIQDRQKLSFKELVQIAGLNPRVDFRGAYLREIDFRDEDLEEFDFAGADLTGADFRRAKTNAAAFQGADLTGAIGLDFGDVLASKVEEVDFQQAKREIAKGFSPRPTWRSHITNLRLGRSGIKVLDGLSELSNLSYLSLRSTSIDDLSPISGLRQLKELYLDNSNVNNLDPIGNMVGITRLNADECGQIYSIYPIENLRNLTFLSIPETGVSDISPISNMRDLIYLNFSRTSVSDLTAVGNLIKLKYLSAFGLNIQKIPDLSKLKELTNLYIGDVNNNLEFLNNLESIHHLSFVSSAMLEMPSLNSARRLRNLYLRAPNLTNADNIAKIKGLNYLDIDATELDNFIFLNSMTDLRSITIRTKKTIRLRDLDGINRVRSISIGAASVVDLDGISKFRSLENLYVRGYKIVNADGLVDLKDIKVIDLTRSEFEKLPDLSGLPKLHFLVLPDGKRHFYDRDHNKEKG